MEFSEQNNLQDMRVSNGSRSSSRSNSLPDLIEAEPPSRGSSTSSSSNSINALAAGIAAESLDSPEPQPELEPELDYGEVPAEPPVEDKEGSFRISIKLPNGKSHARCVFCRCEYFSVPFSCTHLFPRSHRRYNKSDSVRVLFAIGTSLVQQHGLSNPSSQQDAPSFTSFDLVTAFPARYAV
jgi:hypothetical protein